MEEQGKRRPGTEAPSSRVVPSIVVRVFRRRPLVALVTRKNTNKGSRLLLCDSDALRSCPLLRAAGEGQGGGNVGGAM